MSRFLSLAAVLAVEVLPGTGGARIRVDWLERTSPNNLHPFVAVVPSGVAAGYSWSREESAGRTSLPRSKEAECSFPRRGPGGHGDLDVLICGGITIGAWNALDNYGTIYPDDPAPDASSRQSLPDPQRGPPWGSRFLACATDPNLDAAVPYDPAKPANRGKEDVHHGRHRHRLACRPAPSSTAAFFVCPARLRKTTELTHGSIGLQARQQGLGLCCNHQVRGGWATTPQREPWQLPSLVEFPEPTANSAGGRTLIPEAR
ncbi:hypothetical protein MKZ38_008413 [Zalerion maritima]|uniref:Uncharacterized protein n=1 Tax=Zalerion maritima TaxID=339359 RepID=A0AAD5RHY1_9PEZI|nr:hypothetical protein MKZ38_008413 [Zalerion maritima]